MIITALGGGLGNQMFQYALGRKLALKNSDTLLLDLSAFATNPEHAHYRRFGLGHFGIAAGVATPEQIYKAKYPLGTTMARAQAWVDLHVLKRRHVKFESYILNKKGNVYLSGFWQSYKYFDSIRSELLRELSLKNPLTLAAQEVANGIATETQKGQSVASLHVRRGDYVENEKNRQYFSSHCTHDYYLRALELIKEKVKSDKLSIFVFSDDVEWVKQHMPLPYPTYYVSSYCPDHEQLVLMSQCHHHVIANSSFSWWGAWLNHKAGKVVVGPSVWVQSNNLPINDILLPDWLRT